MALAIFLIFYFVPPVLSLFVGPSFVMFGRVWLFNVMWVFFWPILILLIPWRCR